MKYLIKKFKNKMDNIFKTIDFLAPEITLYHKGELFHYSIISGIISLISIILIITSGFYFARPLIWRKNPTTYIYENYVDKSDIYSINSTFFFHFMTMTSYNLSNFIEFDFNSFRVVGMQFPLNVYTEIINKNLSIIDHWLYGPCDNYNLSFNGIFNNFSNFACITKYFNSTEQKYYNFNDTNFKWPHIKYGQINGENDYYSIIIEKCEENTLSEIIGEGNHCKSDLEISNIIDSGKWIILSFADYYVNLKDYDNPNNAYFFSFENRISNGIASISRLNFNPVTIRTNKGYILDKYDERMFYEFNNNNVVQEVNDKIYMNYNFLINNKMKYYERDYQKIQDFISDIGGFAKFISFVASVIIKLYNQYIILKDTKSLISLLYNEEEKYLKNKKVNLNEIVKTNTIRDRNNSFAKINEINAENNDIKLEGKNIQPEENIEDNMKRYNTEQNVIQNDDNDSVFNEKNKHFNFCTYLIYKLTFHKKYKKYGIYSNFRTKIISEEQLIKNHIIIYNLTNATNINKQIYSLKQVMNND